MKLRKVTSASGEVPSARHGRWYADACGAAYAMELVGERWALVIMRELMLGGCRFTDLREGLPGISARVLAERLAGMEAAGIVQRRMLPPPTPAQLYELTPWGQAAEAAMLALCRWSLASPAHDRSLPLSPVALLMSMKALFDPAAAGAFACAGVVVIAGRPHVVRIAGGTFSVARGEGVGTGFRLEAADTGPLKRLVYGKLPVDLVPGLEVQGPRETIAQFVDCFALPAPIA